MRNNMFSVIIVSNEVPNTFEYSTLGSAVNRVKKGLKKKEGTFKILSPTGEVIDLEHYLKS